MSALYVRVLGADFQQLPPILRWLHSGQACTVQGQLQVTWSQHWLIRGLLSILRLPMPQAKASCQVQLRPYDRMECWYRVISRRPMLSGMHYVGPHCIIERLGVISLLLNTRRTARGLWQRSRCLRLLGIPLPFFLIVAREHALDDSRYYCDVRAYLKGFGLILRYHGVLEKA